PVIFEANEFCGGLARGFSKENWQWSLEHFYHHIFTNDREISALATKVGCKLEIKKPLTTSFFRAEEIELDSPLSLLKFSGLDLWSRLRMGFGLLMLKIIPNGLFLERYRATEVLPGLLGEKGYRLIWEKLLKAKFGPYVGEVNLAWFWSRVAKRTKKLGYFEEGFTGLSGKTEEYVKKHGGKIRTGVEMKSIKSEDSGVEVNGERFDAVIVTVPAPVAKKIIKEVKIPEINYLWGQTLILAVSGKLIKGYWMNVLEKDYPFLVVVEHTNMIDKKRYAGNRLIYLGNYLPEGHKQLKMTKERLVNLYLPFLRKINKRFRKKYIKESFLFREPFAQPVFPVNYSGAIPHPRVFPRVYLANMSMVYPFDRGTNYAVKLGQEVAQLVKTDLNQ
ncbi:MAG: hypothetical protein ACD_61C00018G0002, partial [uncultured bacterium]